MAKNGLSMDLHPKWNGLDALLVDLEFCGVPPHPGAAAPPLPTGWGGLPVSQNLRDREIQLTAMEAVLRSWEPQLRPEGFVSFPKSG